MRKRTTSSYIERVLNVWAIVLIIWSIYRSTFHTDFPIWFDEFIAKPLIFLLPIHIFIKRNEKKNFFTAVGLIRRSAGREMIVGVALGLIFFLAGAIGVALHEGTPLFSFLALIHGKKVLYFGIIALATSVSEEILSRGFVLKRLYADSKNIYSSSFFASVLFFFLHIPILFTLTSVTGTLLLQVMITDIVLSLIVSFLFLRRKNLVVPIFVHAFYSLSIYLFI